MNHSPRTGRRVTLPALAGLLLALVVTPATPAQEWTRFRGPNGQGISAADPASVPVKWAEKDLNWKVELPGVGHSSPVVWGEKVFVTCADEDSGQRVVVCVGAGDGKVLWKREWDGRAFKHHQYNSFASASPAVDADHLYLIWPTPEQLLVIALDHEGKDVWKRDLGPYVAQHGGGASPMIYGDLLVVPNDQDRQSSLIALDRKTGEVRWKTPRKSTRFAAATPVVFKPEGGGAEQLVFISHAHGVTGVDPADGRVLWEVPGAFTLRVICSPGVGAGLIFGSCGEGPKGKNVAAVRPGAGGKPAELVYQITTDAPYVPSPLVKGGLLYLWSDTGTVTCAKAATGELVWKGRVPGDYFASPVSVGDRIYNVSRQGEVVCLKAGGDKFELLGVSPLGEQCHATPAIANGRMILRTYGHLMSVGK